MTTVSRDTALGIIDRALQQVPPRSAEYAILLDAARRAREPLRVALTGPLKAGKSMLLNALVGEEIAPTDATECTRLVTWFRRSSTPRVDVVAEGRRRPRPVDRTHGHLSLDLGGVPAAEVDAIEIGWPSELLEQFTVIDTPGTSSNSLDVSRRTTEFLLPDDAPCPVDAVIYLFRGEHIADRELLRELQDSMSERRGPLGIIGVLSRADELHDGHDDPMAAAREIAERLRDDQAADRAGYPVVPVSGLLAVRGSTLRQSQFDELRALAAISDDRLSRGLIAAHRFASDTADLPLTGAQRASLFADFGAYGLRAAIAAIRAGASDCGTLADELVRLSGLDGLRDLIDVQFGRRAETLRAHSALQSVHEVLRRRQDPSARALDAHVQRLLADTHMFTEIRALTLVDTVDFDAPVRTELAILLGRSGTAPSIRLRVPPSAGPAEIADAALVSLRRWRTRAADPMLSPAAVHLCDVAARTCDGLLAAGVGRAQHSHSEV